MAPFTSALHHPPDKHRPPKAALYFPFMKIHKLSTNMLRASENQPLGPHRGMSVLPMLQMISFCVCKVLMSVIHCCMSVTDFLNMKIFFLYNGQTVVMMGDSKKNVMEGQESPVQDVWNTEIKMTTAVSKTFSAHKKIRTSVSDKTEIRSDDLEMDRDVELLDWLDWEPEEEQDERDGESSEKDDDKKDEEEESETEWSEEEDSDWADEGDLDLSAESTELWESFFMNNDPYSPLCFSCSTGSKTKTSDPLQSHSPSSPMVIETKGSLSAELHRPEQRTKKVRFSEDVTVHYLMDWGLDSRAARDGSCWLEQARDRDRFRRRIEKADEILKPCLTAQHRARVWDRLQGGVLL